jgi:predicted dehydrogenase
MTLRIGLLGASRIGPRAILEPAQSRADVAVTCVAARDPDRARAFAQAHGVSAIANDYAELVTRDDVDVVYNGLPPAAHKLWTLRALEAGKGVLCEKPFALNAGEARDMVEAARASGGLLLEAYHYRHHRVMHDAVALMRSGALGRPVSAEAFFDVPIARSETELRWRAELGGGALMDLGCYPLHALRSLLGAEPAVRAASAEFVDGVDASFRAELDFAGVPAAIRSSMVAERPGAALTIVCEQGRLEIINFVAPQIGCRVTVVQDGVERIAPTDGPTTYAAQLDHVTAVWGGEERPLLDGEDAVAQMAAIDAIYAAAGR